MPSAKPAEPPPQPNIWLQSVLAQPELPPAWFSCLVYRKLAERFGNSSEGKFGPGACWFISLGETEDIADPGFKGIFLTEKGSLGFVNQGQVVRFCQDVAFIGPPDFTLEGIEVHLVAVGLDALDRVVFIVNDDCAAKFDVAEATLADVLSRLREQGAAVLSIAETLNSSVPIEVVWTVPAEQADPNDPQVLESTPPAA